MENELSKTLFAPMSAVIDFPFYPRIPAISLELTSHCNLRCPYCLNATLQRTKKNISWELLVKIVDEAAEKKLEISNLHGAGEPLTWNRLEDAIRLIHSRNAGLATFGTNGVLLSEERFRSLLDAGLTQIYFSIDTLDPALYRTTRGGSLEKVVSNIMSAIRLAPKDFQIIIALMNHKDQLLSQKNIAQYHETFGNHANVQLNMVENMFFPGTPEDYRVKPQKIDNCFSPANYLFIDTDGNVAVCCMDQNVKHRLGNVMEQSINDIWFDQRNQTLFRNLALGVFEVPKVCTQECMLSKPKTSQNMVALGFGLPFTEALRLANIFALNKEFNSALTIAQHLLARDSKHNGLKDLIEQLNNNVQTPS